VKQQQIVKNNTQSESDTRKRDLIVICDDLSFSIFVEEMTWQREDKGIINIAIIISRQDNEGDKEQNYTWIKQKGGRTP